MKSNLQHRLNRRKFLTGAATLAGSAAVVNRLKAQVQTREPDKSRETSAAANKNKPLLERIDPKPTHPPGQPGKDYTPVVTPNGSTLPWKILDGVKAFHLVAKPVPT